MGKPHRRNRDFSPGMKVKNLLTGQLGTIARDKRPNQDHLVVVHILNPSGSVSGKSTTWKVKSIEVV